uniref:Ubiquitin-like protein ATG12 n=1 Tax=Macrostomum lignano TaxID=282301 RepID=A0A1I8JN95_9PLAT
MGRRPFPTSRLGQRFVKKALKCQPDESLFLYVNQAFLPAPDRDFGGLYDCFGADGKLTLHYCKTQAWG